MKKIIAITLLAILSVTTLCACKELDAKRYGHGTYVDDSYEEIRFHGNTYLRIPNGQELIDAVYSEENKDIILLNHYTSQVDITKKDVPVMLKRMFGNRLNAYFGEYDEPVMLSLYNYDDTSSYGHMSYYCREDLMDEVVQSFVDMKIDSYYFSYVQWLEAEECWMDRYVLMDASVNKIIGETLHRDYDPAIDYLEFNEIHDLCTEHLELEACDAHLIFTDETKLQIARTMGPERKYYIGLGYGYFNYDDSGAIDAFDWRQVDAKDTADLDALFSTYQNYWEEYWLIDYHEFNY